MDRDTSRMKKKQMELSKLLSFRKERSERRVPFWLWTGSTMIESVGLTSGLWGEKVCFHGKLIDTT